VVTLDDDGAHSRISGLTRCAQAIQTAGHSKIRRRRHIRPEVNMHIDGSVHDLVNHRAKIFLCEHDLSFLFRLFRVFCEERFTTEAQRGAAATKRIGISPAKTQSPQRKRNNIYPNLAFFAPWRDKISESAMFHMSENLRKPRKLSSIEFAEIGEFF
jgi:hypothetical protein